VIQEDAVMPNKLVFLGLGLFILLTIGMMSVFTVAQTEKAIKFRWGEIVEDDFEAGLHFKWPLINNIKKFDARIQTMAEKPEQFLTVEQKNVMVDLFVKWRIGNVTTFYTAVGGNVDQANVRLNQTIKSAIRSEFGKRDIKHLLSTDRDDIRNVLMEKSKTIAPVLGIDIIDVQVMRIDFSEEVTPSVFRRMEKARESVASKLRSEGAETAEGIRANADKQRVVELANAFRDAEKLRGEGDASSADIYSKAYGEDTEFFTFYRSLNAYKKTFSKSSVMVVDPNSDFFQYFNKQK
jgi:membrane protease subunit HflC